MMINGSLNENSKEKNQHLFNIFPVGMLIFAKTTDNNKTEFALKYINETAFKIFRKSNPRSEEEIKETFKKFKKLEKFSTLSEVYSNMNDVTEENLYNRIFEDLDKTESELSERYISEDIMIYVKIKIYQEYKLVTIENFDEERIAIQNNVMKNIKTQYLLTLSHELNNPLNSLAHLVNKILSTEEIKDKEEKMKLIKAIKVNTNLIKHFIKTFIFYTRMSFEMSSVVQPEEVDENKKKECLNLKYILNKIKEKYFEIFQTKKVKLECNFNPLENIFITYDFIYLKSMMKNIFMYLFHRVERKGGIKIEFEFEKELKILFKKVAYKKNKNFADIKFMRQPSKLDTIFVEEVNIESSVKTSKILYDVIKKFAALLGLRVTIIEDESPCYLILHLKYEIEENLSQMSQDLAEEYTYRNSKKKNLTKLDKSISVILDRSADNYRIEINKPGKTMIRLKDIFCTQSALCGTCGSTKITNKSFVSNKKKTQIAEQEVTTNRKEHNYKYKVLKPKKITSKINKCSTFGKKSKSNLSMNSSINSDKEKHFSDNKNQKAMVMRSGFSSKYTKYKSFENELDFVADIVMVKTNEFSKNNIPTTNNFHNILEESIENIKDLHECKDEIKNKFNSGNTIKINKNINTTNNNYSINISNTSLGSIRSIKKKASISSLVKQTKPKTDKATLKFIGSTKIISSQTSENLKNPRNELKKLSFIKPIPENLKKNLSMQPPTNSRNIDILVVDDDKFNLNVLQSMLKKLKLSSDTCMNGLECLNKVKSKYEKGMEYKLILMDVMMPIMDGIAASTKIEDLINDNNLNDNISIIIISAHNNQDIINRANKLSVVKEFLSKPVKNSDIERIIERYYK